MRRIRKVLPNWCELSSSIFTMTSMSSAVTRRFDSFERVIKRFLCQYNKDDDNKSEKKQEQSTFKGSLKMMNYDGQMSPNYHKKRRIQKTATQFNL